jgi:hypothetical protein
MSTATERPTSEMSILRRLVDRKHAIMSKEAAKAILQLGFDAADRTRMNRLAEKNRAGRLTSLEHDELDNFIHVGQMLGILKSKARAVLKSQRTNGLS